MMSTTTLDLRYYTTYLPTWRSRHAWFQLSKLARGYEICLSVAAARGTADGPEASGTPCDAALPDLRHADL